MNFIDLFSIQSVVTEFFIYLFIFLFLFFNFFLVCLELERF